MRSTGKKQGLSRVSMGRLLVIWRELDWSFDDKQGLYRAFLEKQARENVTTLFDLLKRESPAPHETTWLADLADLLLAWLEAGQTGLRLFLLSGLEQNGRSNALLRLHAFLTRHVRSRLAVRYTDQTECALSARCFVDLIFHFGLMRTVEGKWPSGVAREQIVQTIVRMVLSNSAPDTLSRDPKSKSEEDSMASTSRLRLMVRRGVERMKCSRMDNKQRQKEQQRTRVPEKEEPPIPEKEDAPIQWELSDDDKAFLRSCNISSKEFGRLEHKDVTTMRDRPR